MPISDPLDDDPGWPPGRRVLLFLIPGYLRRSAKDGDGLLMLRQVFLAFVSALIAFQVVLVLIGTTDEPTNVALAIGLLIWGALNVLAVEPLIERRAKPDCSSEVTLAGWYTTRFFLRVAFAESAALFGFVGFFVANVWWVYPASLITAAIGFARLAPTREHLVADQEALRSQGCNLMLVRALRQPSDA